MNKDEEKPIQGSQCWLNLRKKSVTASDIPVLMQESPYKLVRELWEEKKGLKTNYETDAMRLGKELEPVIRRGFEELMLTFINEVPEPVAHPNEPRFIASLDGLSADGTIGCELKSANATDHALACKGYVPKKYFGQVQWQMYCTGLKEWWYVSFGKSCKTLKVIKVERDNEYIEKAVEKAYEFLDLMKLDAYPVSSEPIPLKTLDAIYKYKDAEQRFRIAEKEREIAKQELLDSCDGKEVEAHGVKVTKITRRGSVQYDKIDALKDLDLENYRKPDSVYFTITVKE